MSTPEWNLFLFIFSRSVWGSYVVRGYAENLRKLCLARVANAPCRVRVLWVMKIAGWITLFICIGGSLAAKERMRSACRVVAASHTQSSEGTYRSVPMAASTKPASVPFPRHLHRKPVSVLVIHPSIIFFNNCSSGLSS